MNRMVVIAVLSFGAAFGQTGVAEKPRTPQVKISDVTLDGTVITEMTSAGAKLATPDEDQPTCIVVHSGGQRAIGVPIKGEPELLAEALQRQLVTALARGHYHMTDGRQPPTQLIVFNWGVFTGEGDQTDDPGYRHLLEQAALIGGVAFAGELKHVLEQNDLTADAAPVRAWGPQLPGMSSQSMAGLVQSTSPLETFRRRSAKNRQLLDLLSKDCYFVIVSAFDAQSVANGTRQLLWRTKLTSTVRGTSMAEAVFTLIVRGRDYYGRAMTEAEFLSGKLSEP